MTLYVVKLKHNCFLTGLTITVTIVQVGIITIHDELQIINKTSQSKFSTVLLSGAMHIYVMTILR